MIKTKSTMKQILEELLVVGLNETQSQYVCSIFSRLFNFSFSSLVEKLISELKKVTSSDRVGSEVDSSLKSAREITVSSDPKDLNRLLNSALSSARDSKDEMNNNNNRAKNKRNFNDFNINSDGNTRNNSNNNRTGPFNFDNKVNDQNNKQRWVKQRNDGNQQQQFQPPPPVPSFGAPTGTPDQLKYFEQMNEIALKSGFKNAHEMLAMYGGNPAAAPFPYMAPPVPYYPPPYVPASYPPPPPMYPEYFPPQPFPSHSPHNINDRYQLFSYFSVSSFLFFQKSRTRKIQE
jgi:hypothetical protein